MVYLTMSTIRGYIEEVLFCGVFDHEDNTWVYRGGPILWCI